MDWLFKFILGVALGSLMVIACVLMFLLGKNMFAIIDALSCAI